MKIGKIVEERERESEEKEGKVEGQTQNSGKRYGAGLNKCRWKTGCFIRRGRGATG